MLLRIGHSVRHTAEAARSLVRDDPVSRDKLMMLIGRIEEFLPNHCVMVRFDGHKPVRIPLNRLEVV